ncbi:MAG: cytochrome P460 family protein [Minicystis sp.]
MSLLRRACLLAVCVFAAACGDNQDPAGADAFWTSIHEAGYRSWPRAPGYETRQPTNAPHGDSVDIYVNDVVAAALEAGPITAWPEGSRIVKDAFDGDEVTAVAAMEKRATGWYWAEWSAAGAAKYSGSPGLCTGCHESGGDFVRAFPLPR